MARKLRIEYAGAVYHVMNRGDRREAIFRDYETTGTTGLRGTNHPDSAPWLRLRSSPTAAGGKTILKWVGASCRNFRVVLGSRFHLPVVRSITKMKATTENTDYTEREANQNLLGSVCSVCSVCSVVPKPKYSQPSQGKPSHGTTTASRRRSLISS